MPPVMKSASKLGMLRPSVNSLCINLRITRHAVRSSLRLVVVRCISKVADAYKLDKKTQRTFSPLGGIAYDDHIKLASGKSHRFDLDNDRAASSPSSLAVKMETVGPNKVKPIWAILTVNITCLLSAMWIGPTS